MRQRCIDSLMRHNKCRTALASSFAQRRQPQRRYYNSNMAIRPAKPKPPKLTVEEAVPVIIGMMSSEWYKKFVVDIVLNLDPKMEGQELKGVLELPHGTGIPKKVAVLTRSQDLMQAAMEAGAARVDSEHSVLNRKLEKPKKRVGRRDLDMEVVIATTDFEKEVTKGTGLAVRLKRHKIIPCREHKTLVEENELIESVKKYSSGKFLAYTSNRHGHLSIAVGHVDTHEPWQLAENVDYVLKRAFAQMPYDFGLTGKNKSKKHKRGKYLLKVFFGIGSVSMRELDLAKIVPEKDELGRNIHRDVVFGLKSEPWV